MSAGGYLKVGGVGRPNRTWGPWLARAQPDEGTGRWTDTVISRRVPFPAAEWQSLCQSSPGLLPLLFQKFNANPNDTDLVPGRHWAVSPN